MSWKPPYFVARVSFLPTEQGGRIQPTPSGGRFGFPMITALTPDGEANDVFFDLSETGSIHPGQTVVAKLKPLSPESALPRVRVGISFKLWEGKVIAIGEVLEIHRT